MHRYALVAIFALFLLAPAPVGRAAASLAGFESDADLARIRWASQGQSQLARTPRFASAGQFALLFTTPTYKKGLPEWPAFEFKPAVRDWTPYDRLVVDITNPTQTRHFFALFVSDTNVPFRQGLRHTFDVPALGFRRCTITLSALPRTVDRADIGILHFFTQRPEADLRLCLDNLTLLKEGESLAEPGEGFVRQIMDLKLQHVADAETTLDRCRAEAGASGVASGFASLASRLMEMKRELRAPTTTLSHLETVTEELEGMPRKAERLVAISRFQQACSQRGLPAGNMLVGFATSMEKVLPRAGPINVHPARKVDIRLARNEKESFQVGVLAVTEPLQKVTVTVSDLKSPAGDVFQRRHIDCEVVGFVETKRAPPYAVSHVGWWPDPILNFLGPITIEPGDLQTFWIRLRTPKGQPPGLYRGTLTVSAAGMSPQAFDLVARVYSFALPDHSPLPVAITFAPHDHPLKETQAAQGQWRQEGDYPINAWKKHKRRWADFLADYYINYDSLYRHGPPDFAILERLRDQGRLVSFNLGIFDAVSRGPAAARTALADLRTAYARARELGILDRAYIYGFDECKPETFPLLETTAQTLRREFPGVMLMTTSYDHSYGLDTVVKTIDAWCPLTPRFQADQAAQARAAGRKVWWYICCGPHHPHANMFLEYPAIEGRLLMGAMTAQQRPDGFLYYQISIWNSRRPIASGPFTDWDPRSWTTYHGDGAWTCVGPDGTPLPTIRLENFRDGLEDYAYALILEEIIRRRSSHPSSLDDTTQEWLANARAALPVPAALVNTLTDYSRDPAVLYAWRHRMADLICQAGQGGVDPWGPRFGVRGLNPE